jgi:hypothetical protein
MTLADLPLGAVFRQPATGLTGTLLRKGAFSADVHLHQFRAGKVTLWSLATEVEPLPRRPDLPL